MTTNKLAAALVCTLSLSLLSACTKNYYNSSGSFSSSSSSSSSSGSSSSGSSSSGSSSSSSSSSSSGSGSSSSGAAQVLKTSLGAGVTAVKAVINQGTAIGQGSGNGATPFTLTNLATDPNNTSTATVNTPPYTASNPQYTSTGHVPDTAAGFCKYPGATRVSYVTGPKFETAAPGTAGADPMVPMAPFYFPLVYNSAVTLTPNTTFGTAGAAPIIGLFDWRPKDIDEALVAAESDDNGKTWFFMQTVLELFPDYTSATSGGSGSSTSTGCPATITDTNGSTNSPLLPTASGNNADNGWGHAAVIQLPGVGNAKTGQFLYMLDRGAGIDVNQLFVINLASPTGTNGGTSPKFPIWNTNNTGTGANDIKSISSALTNTAGAAAAGNAVAVATTKGLLHPDGIMAVFPTAATAAAGSPVSVLYVEKILKGDNTGSTALPVGQQCTAAPFSKKTNHDISNVHLATTTDGITFTEVGIVKGLNDPTTVDYNKTRWVSPRGTLIDVKGDGSLWGLYFSAGNCLDGDSDAFHYIGYAESTDKMNWTVYNDINSPIASVNSITVSNQSDGASVTIPANAPIVPTQPWFAQRLYAPTATQIDSTHLSMTFAGYGSQTPNNDLLNYRQIGNVVLTVSQALPLGVPSNINAH